MPRRLVAAGIVVTAIGLTMLASLDPVFRTLLFGQGGAGSIGGVQLTRTGSLSGNISGVATLADGGARGTSSVVSVVTIVVFVVAVIGLLLTIAGSFATGKGIPTGAGPSPAAAEPKPQRNNSRSKFPMLLRRTVIRRLVSGAANVIRQT
jgi:hypothetical protein